jgi:cytoskeletal protein CcmA (bactofilin family)
MLNFSRNDRPSDVKDIGKPAVKPSPYGTSPLQSAPPGTQAPVRTGITSTPPNQSPPAPHASAPDVPSAPQPASTTDVSGSKLIVGVNIKLKGVEISNCDVLVIEGQVEATVHSKAMEISKPGTLVGTANIDVAEIHGEFSGELTARTKLVVHGTGRVTGTIRYGKLVVAEGGTLTGDLRQIDGANESKDKAGETKSASSTTPDMRSLLNPQH